MFCKYCGKELEEGELCFCRSIEEVAVEKSELETADVTTDQSNVFLNVEQPFVPQIVKEKEPTAFARFISVLTHFIPQPISAIKQAGGFADKGVGMLACVLQALLIATGFCIYLTARVQVGYSLGFFEQAIPFGEYLAHSGSSLFVLFFQLAGTVLLADLFLIFLLFLLTGGFGTQRGLSKMTGAVGTALLSSGIAGMMTAIAGIFIPDAVYLVLFGGIVLSVLALYTGVRATAEISDTKLFYLFPLSLLIWFGGTNWLISSVPLLSWIFGLL